MQVGKHDDVSQKRDNDYGIIPPLADIAKDANGAESNKCLTFGYCNATKIGIKVHLAR